MTGGVAPARATRWLRAAGIACAALACVALPALVAGVSIDAPVADGELERLAAAHDGTIGSEIARQFELAMLRPWPTEWPEDPASRLRLLASARLMQVLGIFAISALMYLAILLARGRLPALVACVALTALPAIYEVGHVLRPETASVTFAALALLLLQCMAQAVHGSPSRGPRRRAVVLVMLAASTGLATGLAVGAMPTMGGALLVPIALFMLAALQLLLRGCRIGWRRSLFQWPARAITQRLWAPALAALLAPVAALLCLRGSLSVPVDRILPTALLTSVVPANPVLASVLVVLGIVGGLSFLVRTGIRFGRRGRVSADLVLLAYVGTQIAYVVGVEGRFDPLPAAPALAVLVGEGAFGAVACVAWLSNRRRLSAG